MSHTGKIDAGILSKRLESKIVEVIEEDQFGFLQGKGTRDAIRLMRIISERVLCVIDWKKGFDRVDWSKLKYKCL